MTIHKDMTIDEIFETYPQKSQKLSSILGQFGLNCVGCSASTFETLEAGVLGHGMDSDTLNKLIETLNLAVEETLDPTTITITPTAAQQFKKVAKAENKENWGLRFCEKPAGCNGFEYTLDFSEKAGKKDRIFQSEGIEIHVEKTSVARLIGSVIDFTDGLQGSGFKIMNPNVRSACHCGSSHNY